MAVRKKAQATKSTKSTAIARRGSSDIAIASSYPALAGGGAVAKMMQQNLGGEELSVFDLEQIRVPSGGGIAWEVEGPDGEIDATKMLDGIIVFTKIGRSFWSKSYAEESGGPPDCSSPDGIHGYGTPGGICKKCAKAQWGSKGDGNRGQACSQKRFVFLLREGAALPAVLILPPTSMKPMKRWLLSISNNELPYWAVVTRFTLEKQKNSAGQDYSVIKPIILSELGEAEVAAVERFAVTTRETFEQFSESVQASNDEGGGGDSAEDEDF